MGQMLLRPNQFYQQTFPACQTTSKLALTSTPGVPITGFPEFYKLYCYCCYLIATPFIRLTGTYKWKITDVVITFVLQEVSIKL
jgi:hypothetical protein